MQGRVVYSSGGNYKVLLDGETFDAKPLGIFRNENIKILVGDIVELEINENKVGLEEINVITKLLPRKNEFIRPNISNVDYVIIVTSIIEPKLNDYYLDKLIAIFQSFDVEPILVFTKNDIKHNKELDLVIKEYIDAGFKTMITDNKITFEQIQEIND
jgi:ribosome biogenesis GTPase